MTIITAIKPSKTVTSIAVPKRVAIHSSAEEVANSIIKLSEKMKAKTCNNCFKNNENNDCRNCHANWYDSRNAMIKILRNIFDLPVHNDVPKSIFFLASQEAENIEYGNISSSLLKGITRLKCMHEKGILIKMVPMNVVCPSCNTLVPPSRFGYVINGSEPVCWGCEMNRCKINKIKQNIFYLNYKENNYVISDTTN